MAGLPRPGFILGLAILIVRRHVPESPRWLFIHGREDEAEEVTRDIERQVMESTGAELDDPDDTITVNQRESIGLWEITRAIVSTYPRRTVLGLALFIGQAFLYNAIRFGYATLLSTFFGVPTADAPYYLIAFAAGNLLGPIVLGPLFDSVRGKPMISGTYILSGVLHGPARPRRARPRPPSPRSRPTSRADRADDTVAPGRRRDRSSHRLESHAPGALRSTHG